MDHHKHLLQKLFQFFSSFLHRSSLKNNVMDRYKDLSQKFSDFFSSVSHQSSLKNNFAKIVPIFRTHRKRRNRTRRDAIPNDRYKTLKERTMLILLYALYALLLEGLFESWAYKSELRDTVSATVLSYIGLTYILRKRISVQTKAWLSALVLLLLVVFSAWHLGSVDVEGGFTLLGLSTSTLATLISIVTLGIGCAFMSTIIWNLRFIPLSAKLGIGFIFVYTILPFVLGLLREASYSESINGEAFWEWPPFWLQGGYIGIEVFLPLATLVLVGSLLIKVARRLSVQLLKQGAFKALALFLAFLMAIPNLNTLALPNLSWLILNDSDTLQAHFAKEEMLYETASIPDNYEEAQYQFDRDFERLEEVQSRINRAEFDVQAESEQLGEDIEKIFGFTRDEVAYEVYLGVLRGAKGALISQAGNALDKSLLLAELLKTKGLSVRFAFGMLDEDKALALVRQMLKRKRPTPSTSLTAELDETSLKHVTSSSKRYQHYLGEYRKKQQELKKLLKRVEQDHDFINDALQDSDIDLDGDWQAEFASLVKEAQHHVWVQYQREGEWVNLDPSFANAHIGEQFAQTQKIYQEIPENLYHRVTFRVKIEQLQGTKLHLWTALETTRTTADLFGARILFANIPNLSEDNFTLAGLEKATQFLPMLMLDGEPVYSNGFDLNGNEVTSTVFKESLGGATERAVDSIGNALRDFTNSQNLPTAEGPATVPSAEAKDILTAQWFEFITHTPDGKDHAYMREVVDRIGIENRVGARQKTVKDEYRDEKRLHYLLMTQWAILIEPGFLNESYVTNALVSQLVAKKGLMQTVVKANFSQDQISQTELVKQFDEASKHDLPIELLTLSLGMKSLADHLVTTSNAGMTFYRSTTGITTYKTKLDSAPDGKVIMQRGFDVVENAVRTVKEDDVAQARQFNLSMGILQTYLERALALDFSEALDEALLQTGEVSAQFGGMLAPLSTIEVFNAARKAGIQTTLLGPHNAGILERLNVSMEGKARMQEELARGYLLLVPEQSVRLNGQETIGWWKIDPAIGSALGMIESGEGAASVEYIIDEIKKLQIRFSLWVIAHPKLSFSIFFIACTVTSFVIPVFTNINPDIGFVVSTFACEGVGYIAGINAAGKGRGGRGGRPPSFETEELPKAPKIMAATRPAGQKGGKPIGSRTVVRKGAENARSDIRENESADILADKGYKVEQNPPAKPNSKEPDYKIEGEYFDNFAPKEETSARNVVETISGKVGYDQADRIVINMHDSKLSLADLKQGIKDYYNTPDTAIHDILKEIIIIKDGEIIHWLPPYD